MLLLLLTPKEERCTPQRLCFSSSPSALSCSRSPLEVRPPGRPGSPDLMRLVRDRPMVARSHPWRRMPQAALPAAALRTPAAQLAVALLPHAKDRFALPRAREGPFQKPLARRLNPSSFGARSCPREENSGLCGRVANWARSIRYRKRREGPSDRAILSGHLAIERRCLGTQAAAGVALQRSRDRSKGRGRRLAPRRSRSLPAARSATRSAVSSTGEASSQLASAAASSFFAGRRPSLT